MQTKTCPTCKETKPVSEFGKDRSNKCGLQRQCKECKREKERKYYKDSRERNPEKWREKTRRWREANRNQEMRLSRQYFQKRNTSSLELANRKGSPWEDWEDEFVLADNGLTAYQKAVKLERSYSSVATRRRNLKKKARNELTHDTVRV